MMSLKVWIYSSLIILGYGCSSMKPENIRFNTFKGQYEYIQGQQVFSLRDSAGRMVDSTNIGSFRNELQNRNGQYPFDERMESDVLLGNSDFRMASQYARINRALLNKDFPQALKDIAILRQIYPDIDFYSDCPFLEGYACERLGERSRAASAYEYFYSFSDKKYSRRFRGYRHADIKDSLYVAERNHAYCFLNQIPDNLDQSVIRPIIPKYHYTSCQPGFTFNADDFSERTRFLGTVFFGLDLSNDFLGGFQLSYGLKGPVSFNIMSYFSKYMTGYLFSLPIQVYQSESNRFGIKFNPFLHYRSIEKIKLEGVYHPAEKKMWDSGAKLSASFFLNQKWYIGTYYQYNYFNKDRPLYIPEAEAYIWSNNEFDCSAYYNLFKDVSMKFGVKNGDAVIGFNLHATEISYNLTDHGFILRTDIF